MLSQAKSYADVSSVAGCVVGLMEARAVEARDYSSYLSADERAAYVHLPNRVRKGEWLAGRLTAKYLYLNQLELSAATQRLQSTPLLSKLKAEELDVYSGWMYQRLEVLPNDRESGGHLKLVWCGRNCDESVSVSHAGGLASACISVGAPTAIDIETPAPRVEAFYRQNFSEAERHWVARGTENDSTRSNWFFTLLWSLKESALKLAGAPISLWSIPRLEIAGLPDLNQLGRFRLNATADDFMTFAASVKEPHRETRVNVAVSGTRDFILAVMNSISGVIN